MARKRKCCRLSAARFFENSDNDEQALTHPSESDATTKNELEVEINSSVCVEEEASTNPTKNPSVATPKARRDDQLN